MTEYFRRQLFNVIAAVFLLLFVAVWLAVLIRVLIWIPEGDATAPSLNGALVTAAGVLATSLSSLTASALGFTISEVRRDRVVEPAAAAQAAATAPTAGETSYPSEVAARLSGRIIAAIMVYMVIGLLVLILWLFKGTASTDLIGAFALSLLGWLVGAAGVVFQTEKPSH
ncbi:hypothetical protein [Arthrobacter sp. AZCC_0090]|uniref:hypothetical protein n=1 Tax=Arthrobacter sp. AZCC_0090 TaxID=2735881 RepID=UPI00160C9EFA|nr:hypothetical protein [Arthrobacter sp. AZCC_0090]MBB6404837.1 F0F1-type ATP synthase assembly protein I [Arthrobacter sp. AZCC_0090]